MNDLELKLRLLAFTTSPNSAEALADVDKELNDQLTTLHIEVFILQLVRDLRIRDGVVDFLSLRDCLIEQLFHDDDTSKVETRLNRFLPPLFTKGYLVDDFILTELGKEFVDLKEVIFYENDLFSRQLN